MTFHDLETATIGPESLGKALGITRQHVASLTKSGVLVKQGRGVYPLLENVRRYVDYRAQGANSDEWRAARTDHLRVRTAREELALERDRIQMQLSEHDADLDKKFWELLVTFVDFSDQATFELERRGLLVERANRTMLVSNVIHAYVIEARARIEEALAEHRRRQLKQQAETVAEALQH